MLIDTEQEKPSFRKQWQSHTEMNPVLLLKQLAIKVENLDRLKNGLEGTFKWQSVLVVIYGSHCGLKSLETIYQQEIPTVNARIHQQTINLTLLTTIREQRNKEAMQNQQFVTCMGLNPPFNYEARKQQETERKPMEKLIDQQEGAGHSMQLNKNTFLFSNNRRRKKIRKSE